MDEWMLISHALGAYAAYHNKNKILPKFPSMHVFVIWILEL